jgi:serine/threonine-protein kinase
LPPGDDEDADSTARRHLAEDDALPEQERTFGPFTLLRRLAFGGMGEVYLARRESHLPAGLGPAPSRLVVVKRILAHMRRDEKQRRSFVEEARLQTLLRSPHIVQIHDVGEVDGQVYLAMEHVHGPSWRALIDRCRRQKQHIPLGFIVDMMIQAALGLSYAHNLVDAGSGQPLHVVHRDVNPHNVLVTFQGEVKIIDFGIAKSGLSQQHTDTGTIKGKFAYMSPEQSAAEPLDARSDLFALGICFYELVTLSNPFKRGNVVLSLEAIQRTSPPPPSRSRPGAAILDPLIERMLRKNPDDRFADCAEIVDALLLLQQDGLVPEPQQSLPDWLRGLFAAEIENHRRILESTGTLVDVVSTPPRAPRAHSSASLRALPRSPGNATPGLAFRSAAAVDPGRTPTPSPPTWTDPDLRTASANDILGTSATGALTRSSTSTGRILLSAAAAAAACTTVLIGGWLALRAPSTAPPTTTPVLPTVDAGTAAPAAAPAVAPAVAPVVVDAGGAATVVVDAGTPAPVVVPGVVDAGIAATVVVDAGTAATVVAPVVVDAGVAAVTQTPLVKPVKLAPVEADVVARVAVSADGFVVKGPRVLGSRLPTVLVVDDRQAPFQLRLKLRAGDGGAQLGIESEPWAIVRVDQVGRGRTPVANVAVSFGKKTLLSLQNPGGASMEVSLTLSPAR